MSTLIEDYKRETEDIPSSRLNWQGADGDQLAFMRKVYDINQRWSSANGTFIADIPARELDTIEGRHQARTAAAAACREMLAAVRQAIQTAGVQVETGLSSAYRSATRQLSLWQDYFPDYYNETASHRDSLPGGSHGDSAARYLAGYIRGKVAIPGYSNHQNGIALDLLNIENGRRVLNRTRSPYPDRWKESWLWGWLTANANNFGFYQNTNINEPWHWEYRQRTSLSHETYLRDFEYLEAEDAIPSLVYRDATPPLETLYVSIDLGLGRERIFKKSDPRNDTAVVEKMTGIFIPKNFIPASQIELLIYLHGHKHEPLGKDKSINEYWDAKRLPHFAFREILNDSGKNCILVAPTLGPRSQPGNLITNSGFTGFVSSVVASIKEHCGFYKNRETPAIKNIILACHSGSGYNMYKIVQLSGRNEFANKITECWGFDCTYGPDDAEALHEWASKSNDGTQKKVYVYYRKDSGTEAQAVTLKNRSAGLLNVMVTGLANSVDHNAIPGKYFKERLAALDEPIENLPEAYGNGKTPVSSIKIYESENPVQHNSVLSAAYDLFYRGFLTFDVLTAIINGERNQDKLTDMIFQHRHPESASTNPLIRSSARDSRRLRTEWLEIKSKIIAPVFRNENGFGNYGEATTTGMSSDDPFNRRPVRRKKEAGHDDPLRRMEWFHEKRFGINRERPDGQLVAFAEASENIRRLKREGLENFESEYLLDFEKAPQLRINNWASIGPTVVDNGQASATSNVEVSGRITSMAIGPSGKRAYVGSANGGVWFSADGGNNWKPLYDFADSPDYRTALQADSLSIGAIAVKFGATADKDQIYVGTGEPNRNFNAYMGIGIKFSANGGQTWKLEATNLKGIGIYEIVIDRKNNAVFAATTMGLFRRPSTSNRENWTAIPTPGTNITDFVIADIGSSKKYYASVLQDDVYESIDLIKWVAIPGINKTQNPLLLPTDADQNPNRIVLSVSEKDPSILYAFHQYADTNAAGNAIVYKTNLYRLASTDLSKLSTGSFNEVDKVPSVFNGGGQGWYSLAVAVDPSDADTVYFAGNFVEDGTHEYPLSLFKGKILHPAGARTKFTFSFTNTSHPNKDATYVGTGIHADIHGIEFAWDATGLKHDANKVWINCDGGLFVSDAAGKNGTYTTKNNGLAITQMTYLAQHPDIPAIIFGGCQDNGTVRFSNQSRWRRGDPYGDGGGIAIDPNDSKNLLSQSNTIGLWRNRDGGITDWQHISTFPPDGDEGAATAFYGPIAVSPKGSPAIPIVAFGTHRLWLSADWGVSWVTLPTKTNPYLPSIPLDGQDVIGTITCVKITSSSKSSFVARIYATTPRDVFRFDQDATTGRWTRIRISNSGFTLTKYFITSLDVDPNDSSNFYISLGGSGTFIRCYYFENAAAKWHPVGPPKEILNVPCRAVVVDPEKPGNVYLGSDVGVWKLTLDPKNPFKWKSDQYSNGLPESSITDLKIHEKARLLRAATHGRGVWEIAIDQTASPAADLYIRMNAADNGRIDPRTKKRFDWNITGKGIPDPSQPGKFIADPFNCPDIDAGPFFPNTSPSVRVTVHNRGWKTIKPKEVRVYLLMTALPIIGTVPALPKNFNTHMNKGSKDPKWLADSEWKFADPSNPYSSFMFDLQAYQSREVYFSPDFSQLVFSPGFGFHMACFAAFIISTDGTNIISGTNTDIDQLVISDNHVAYKKAGVP